MRHATPHATNEPSAPPKRTDALIVMPIAYGWNERQSQFALPDGEPVTGTALTVLLIHRIDAKGMTRKPAGFTQRKSSRPNAHLIAISRGVAP
jgi:hypothetical protein